LAMGEASPDETRGPRINTPRRPRRTLCSHCSAFIFVPLPSSCSPVHLFTDTCKQNPPVKQSSRGNYTPTCVDFTNVCSHRHHIHSIIGNQQAPNSYSCSQLPESARSLCNRSNNAPLVFLLAVRARPKEPPPRTRQGKRPCHRRQNDSKARDMQSAEI
jgi:hypothetical protein